MIFDQDSNPVAIYWKNGTLKYFTLKEMSETDMDLLWEVPDTFSYSQEDKKPI